MGAQRSSVETISGAGRVRGGTDARFGVQARVVEEDLAAMGGVSSTGNELLDAAEQLVQAVKSNAPEAAAAVGVNLKEVEAAALRIRSVRSSGTGVRVEPGLFHGDIEIDDVQAGQHGEGIEGPADPSTARQ